MVNLFAWCWRAIFGRARGGLVETQVADAERRVAEAFAYEQADLVRDGKLTKEQALAAIAERFPNMTPSQVTQTLARGMFLSR